MVEITEVRVSLRNDDKLKAFVSITLNDSFVVRGLKIIRGNSGLFVAMPSRKRPGRAAPGPGPPDQRRHP
jgi:stage V sporulation protein G